jgi:hypothetical protein
MFVKELGQEPYFGFTALRSRSRTKFLRFLNTGCTSKTGGELFSEARTVLRAGQNVGDESPWEAHLGAPGSRSQVKIMKDRFFSQWNHGLIFDEI